MYQPKGVISDQTGLKARSYNNYVFWLFYHVYVSDVVSKVDNALYIRCTLILQYKLKKCLKKEFCKRCRHVNGKGKKWPVHRKTHRTIQKQVEHHDATDIQKKL